MQPNTQEVPGYFVWQPPEKPFAVHLQLGVVERLNAEIMRGFALVPRRGAEVGGVLFGSIETGKQTVVRVEDFEPVACEYRRGPSFYLTDAEQEALEKTATGSPGGLRAVGYYRSHTRDGVMALSAEDLDVIERCMPDVSPMALLVRPFATKVSVGGCFVRENGAFPEATPLEFPFRRREMLGEEAPARRPMEERRPRNRPRRAEQQYEQPGQLQVRERDVELMQERVQEAPPRTWEELSDPPRPRNPWMWLPLALVLIALGTALGYQLTKTYGPQASTSADFALNLSVGTSGDSLTVRWNRDSAAVGAAQRGSLEILDGEFSKSVALDASHLREGTVIYQNSSPKVRFRMILSLGANSTLTETINWPE